MEGRKILASAQSCRDLGKALSSSMKHGTHDRGVSSCTRDVQNGGDCDRQMDRQTNGWMDGPTATATATTHRPKQVLVLYHHAHHFGCTLCQLLLILGELGRPPSGQEEIGGHHGGNIPQGHLVVLLLGCHLSEEFQECLEKDTDPTLNSSIALFIGVWAERGGS